MSWRYPCSSPEPASLGLRRIASTRVVAGTRDRSCPAGQPAQPELPATRLPPSTGRKGIKVVAFGQYGHDGPHQFSNRVFGVAGAAPPAPSCLRGFPTAALAVAATAGSPPPSVPAPHPSNASTEPPTQWNFFLQRRQRLAAQVGVGYSASSVPPSTQLPLYKRQDAGEQARVHAEFAGVTLMREDSPERLKKYAPSIGFSD
jgi:hypothetical protein